MRYYEHPCFEKNILFYLVHSSSFHLHVLFFTNQDYHLIYYQNELLTMLIKLASQC